MSLDSHTLERLIIDREMGELTGDAAALLESYLASEPAKRDGLESIKETISEARRLLNYKVNADTGALSIPHFMRLSPARMRFADYVRGGFVGFAVAASIAMAAWVGYGPSAMPMQTQSSSQLMVSNAGHNPSSENGNFWNVNGLRRSQSARPSGESNKIEWTGPISRPKIGA